MPFIYVQAVKQEYDQDPVMEPLLVSFAPAKHGESMKLHLDLKQDGVYSDGWKIVPLAFPLEVIVFTYINYRVQSCTSSFIPVMLHMEQG